MSETQDEWLALTTEAPLAPDLPICDPHHHLFDDPAGRHPRYLLDELRRDADGLNLVRTVFVDCMAHYLAEGPEMLRPVGETIFVRQVAEESATTAGCHIAGIVGYADMTLGDRAQAVLEAHLQAGGARFKGIRHATGWDPTPFIRSYRDQPGGMLLDADFRRGIACVARMGLSFDAHVHHHQLPEVASLARAFPEMPIIVNHTGLPLGIGPYAGQRDDVFRHWRGGMADLAGCPNVYVKLGGTGMAVFGFGWQERPAPPSSEEYARATAPYFEACIELFGAERCMFESNFPVDRSACSYVVLWNAFVRVTRAFSSGEIANLFHDTAVRAYRLA
jgi:predicted TIM-barrel fold metal-dependent hydrolase